MDESTKCWTLTQESAVGRQSTFHNRNHVFIIVTTNRTNNVFCYSVEGMFGSC